MRASEDCEATANGPDSRTGAGVLLKDGRYERPAEKVGLGLTAEASEALAVAALVKSGDEAKTMV